MNFFLLELSKRKGTSSTRSRYRTCETEKACAPAIERADPCTCFFPTFTNPDALFDPHQQMRSSVRMLFPSRLARSILQQHNKLGSPVSSLQLRPTALVRSQHASRPGRSFGTGGRTTSSKDKGSRTAVWAVVRHVQVPRRPSHQAHLHAFSTALRPDARCDLSDDLPHPARLSSRSATRKDVSGRERCRSQKTQLA